MSIFVKGVPETLAALGRIAALGKLAVEAGVKAVGEDVAETARGLVPVETGELRDSITTSEEGVVAGTDHAVYVEFGTYKMAAEPFMRPAADEASEDPAVRAASQVFGGI